MCAAFELNSRTLRPGRLVRVWRAHRKQDVFAWAGFAKHESLGWWKRKGGELVDVPAHRFAERSDRDRHLRWDTVPDGHVLRGLLDPNDGKPLLKIVTRASTPAELTRFEHPRMPVIEPPLFSAEPIESAEEPQQELF